jgi:uncharacterized protein YgiM (DUF1202 family)
MKKQKLQILLVVAILGAMALACTAGESDSSSGPTRDPVLDAAETLQAQLTLDAGGQPPPPDQEDAPSATSPPPDDQEGEPPTATLTLSPTTTETPTVTATFTLSVPMVTVSQNTNCRAGDLKAYDMLGALLVGETAEVIGKNADGDYWVVRLPDGKVCWLWGTYATVSGDTSKIPVMTPPPTPTPTHTATATATATETVKWDGNWTTWVPSGTWTGQLTHTGNTVSGTLTQGANWIQITGSVSGGGKELYGTWTDSFGSSGGFSWTLKKNINQFIGSWTVDGSTATGEWCGARKGASKPSPCQWP